MSDVETTVTRDPSTLADRDYYTVAYAEKSEVDDGHSLFA